jgi:hypothetical protein
MTEPKHATITWPTDEKMQEAADAYALAVGRVSGAWNYFHRTLGELFAVIIGGDAELLLNAWRSIENDRSQREMLRATIKAASPERWKQTPKARADLLWVLGRADALSDVRNDAIHALVMLHIGPETIVDVAFPPRGKRERKLLDNAARGKKLLGEFAKGEQDTDALSLFVQRATSALAYPDRQEWPTPRPKQTWNPPKSAQKTAPKS